MRKLVVLIFGYGFGFGWIPPQATTHVPAPAAHVEGVRENPAITALALKIYSQMRAGKVDETLLSDTMNKELSPMTLALQKPFLDQLGNPVRLTLESSDETPYGMRWVYFAVFATARLHVKLYVMSDGRVGGYELAF